MICNSLINPLKFLPIEFFAVQYTYYVHTYTYILTYYTLATLYLHTPGVVVQDTYSGEVKRKQKDTVAECKNRVKPILVQYVHALYVYLFSVVTLLEMLVTAMVWYNRCIRLSLLARVNNREESIEFLYRSSKMIT